MKHCNIVLIVDGSVTFHESTEKAIEHSNDRKYDDAKIAHIYAYQMTARKGGFRWNDDAPKKKTVKPRPKNDGTRKFARWNSTEQAILVKAKKDGKQWRILESEVLKYLKDFDN